MASNRLVLAALAVTCVGAAAAGGYVATRQGATTLAAPPAQTFTAATESAPQAPAKTAQAPVEAAHAPAEAPRAMASAAATEPARPAAPATVAAATRRPAAAVNSGPERRASELVTTREEPAQTPDRGPQTPLGAPGGVGAPGATPGAVEAQPPVRTDDRSVDAQRMGDSPVADLEELVVASDSVIGLQTESAVTSERARVEDRVEARVVRDVRVGGRVAIPAGTRVVGSVVVVERGGRFKDRARLGIRFETLVLADGTRLPITTETIYRFSDAPGNVPAARIGGGAVVGAIIGGIIGGGKGAAIGATTGAGAGTASVMAGDRGVATFPAGAEVTARILSPVTVTIENN